MAHPERFELPTKWFEATYSIQLSYGCGNWLYLIVRCRERFLPPGETDSRLPLVRYGEPLYCLPTGVPDELWRRKGAHST